MKSSFLAVIAWCAHCPRTMARSGAMAIALLFFAGCFAVKTSEPTAADVRFVSENKQVVQAEIYGIEPQVIQSGKNVKVSLYLIGTFKFKTTKTYSSTIDHEEYIAFGLFPGVMSCEGEYGDCIPNGIGAFFYNTVFACLPTVYGLLIEPFVPHYPPQTESIVGQSAFFKSALLGFSRYSKPVSLPDTHEVSYSSMTKLLIEDAVISAPKLHLESEKGRPLQIPVAKLPADGNVGVKVRLPNNHPLKAVMTDFENVEITIPCKNQEVSK